MNTPRVPLYERLPEIYRIKDAEQLPADQLKAYLATVESAFSAIHENIEWLYHDLFIDTCDEWVIPYIADLVGASHLSGDARTLRADVADTIALRRRKGTLAAIERLAANLTGWASRAVELRENLGWTQHLNHLRPDAGGRSHYANPAMTRFPIRRGGTVPIRDAARLSLLGTPFDQAAYTADVKPATDGAVHPNLPNLAIFLWRLLSHRLQTTRPLMQGVDNNAAAAGDEAPHAVRFNLDALGRVVRLFNVYRPENAIRQGRLTLPDEVNGPIPAARLNSNAEAGNPEAYVHVDTFDPTNLAALDLDLFDAGLNVFVPVNPFGGVTWSFRGGNLRAWAAGVRPPVRTHEIVVDPVLGRVLIGVGNAAERDAINVVTDGFAQNVMFAYSYASAGEVGAHPLSRSPRPTTFQGEAATVRIANSLLTPGALQTELANLHNEPQPTIVEITDSLIHDIDLATIAGTATTADGPVALQFNRSVIIRAADGHRPTIRLSEPLRLRPTDPTDASVQTLTVRFEGVFITRGPGFPANEPLVARTAVASVEFLDCTLDPGGFRVCNGSRETSPVIPSIRLGFPHGFANAADETAFAVTPKLLLQRTITGPLHIHDSYSLETDSCIVDARRGVLDSTDNTFAIVDNANSPAGWGPRLKAKHTVFFGRVRVKEAAGAGSIFVHRLEVHNNQKGCIKYSYFRGDADRLPQNHACVTGNNARLRFTSEWFGDGGYAQLAHGTDSRILTRGPGDDQMGAFGALHQEAHKWINLQVRLREFMPLGVRPLVVAVT